MRSPLAVFALLLALAVPSRALRIDAGQVALLPVAPYFSTLLIIGVNAEGSVTIDGGTQSVEDSVALGGLPPGDGTLVVRGTGSQLTLEGDATTRAVTLNVASAGVGSALIEEGALVLLDGTSNLPGDLGANVVIALEGTGVGDLTVTGAGSTLRVENGAADGAGVSVGFQGVGTLTIADGGELQVLTGTGANGGGQVGGSGSPAQPGGEGLAVVTGAGSKWSVSEGAFSIGSTSVGTLRVEEGGEAVANNLFVGLQGEGDGVVEVRSGGTVAAKGTDPLLGFGGSGNVGMAGRGRLEVHDGHVTLDTQDGTSHGLLVGGTTGCGGPCPFTGGVGEVLLDGASASLTVSGPLGFAVIGADGEGSLTARGGALFEVENPDDASGTSVALSPGSVGSVVLEDEGTRFDAGVGLALGLDLALADAGTARVELGSGSELRAGVGGVALGSTATLAGSGLVSGDVFNLRGTLSPGASAGTLSVAGGYEQSQAEAELRIELAGRAQGEWDRLEVSGDLALLAGRVRFEAAGGFLPAAGDEFPFATAGGALVQDPALAYEAAGAMNLGFEVVSSGDTLTFRALSDASGFGACQSGQLKALAKLCKKVLGCEAKRLKKPAKDADGAKRDACVAKAEAAFARGWDKAAARGARKGEPCVLGEGAADAGALAQEPAADFLDALLVGWDEAAGNAADDRLRGALAKEGGALCGRLLAADARQMAKRSDAKWERSREKARSAFEARAGKAIQKGDARGAAYGGAAADTLLGIAVDGVADATGRTAGLSP